MSALSCEAPITYCLNKADGDEPVAVDLHQGEHTIPNPAGTGGGCCRTSIMFEIKALYRAFEDADARPYPHYLKKRIERTYFEIDVSSPPALTHWYWLGEVDPFDGVIPQITQRITHRFRSPLFERRAREEYLYLDENGDPGAPYPNFHGFAGILIGGLFSVEYDGGGEAIHTTTFENLTVDNWVQESPTRKTRNVTWDRHYDGDFVATETIGQDVEELSEIYDWADFLASMNDLLEDGFDNVAYPLCGALKQWRDGDEADGACMVKLGVECCAADNWPIDPLYDDGHGTGYNSWPLPNTFAGECEDEESCGGFGPTGIPWDLECITLDILNSDNELYADNANTGDSPEPYVIPLYPLWQIGTPANPYVNDCATAQMGVEVTSPPLHFTASVMFDSSFGGILLTRRAVKRWWDGKVCRVVTESLVEGEVETQTQIACELLTQPFTGPNLVPSSAEYSGAGAYALTGLTEGRCYYWTKGASDTSLVSGATTLTASGEFVAAASTTLNGTVSVPVTAWVQGNISLAPCSWVDDPAVDTARIDPADELSEVWTHVATWHEDLEAGQARGLFVEMVPPDTGMVNPPCGCEP